MRITCGNIWGKAELIHPCLPAGLVLEPLPVGAWAFLAVTTAVATKTLTFAQVRAVQHCAAMQCAALRLFSPGRLAFDGSGELFEIKRVGM